MVEIILEVVSKVWQGLKKLLILGRLLSPQSSLLSFFNSYSNVGRRQVFSMTFLTTLVAKLHLEIYYKFAVLQMCV